MPKPKYTDVVPTSTWPWDAFDQNVPSWLPTAKLRKMLRSRIDRRAKGIIWALMQRRRRS